MIALGLVDANLALHGMAWMGEVGKCTTDVKMYVT